MGVGEVVAGGRILPSIGMVRGYIRRVRGDGDWVREIDLLPTARRLVGEGGAGEQGARDAPQIADMRTGVLWPLVEADAGNFASRRRLELDPEINRLGVAYRHDA